MNKWSKGINCIILITFHCNTVYEALRALHQYFFLAELPTTDIIAIVWLIYGNDNFFDGLQVRRIDTFLLCLLLIIISIMY